MPPKHKVGRSNRPERAILELILLIRTWLTLIGKCCHLPADLAHAFEDDRAVLIHVIGAALQRQRQNCGETRRLLPVDIASGDSVIIMRSRLRTVHTRAPFDHVEIELENAPLTEDQFGHGDERQLASFAEERAAGSEEQIFYELLRNGGASANAATFHVALGGELNCLPIEAVMLVEATVFRGDNGMLESGRDLAQRDKFASFLIGNAVNPRLNTALHVDGGGWRVDPTKSDKGKRGERPEKDYCDEKPSKEGSQIAFPDRGPNGRLGRRWRCGWAFEHTSE